MSNPFAEGMFKRIPPMKLEDAVKVPGTATADFELIQNLCQPVVDSQKIETMALNASTIVQLSGKQMIMDEIKMVEGMLLNLVVKLKISGAENAAKVMDKARDGVRRILEANE